MLWASQEAPVIKNPLANAEDTRDTGSIPGPGRSPGDMNSYPRQCSCLENAMDRGAWRATVRGVTKSQTCWAQCLVHYYVVLPWDLYLSFYHIRLFFLFSGRCASLWFWLLLSQGSLCLKIVAPENFDTYSNIKASYILKKKHVKFIVFGCVCIHTHTYTHTHTHIVFHYRLLQDIIYISCIHTHTYIYCFPLQIITRYCI